MNHQGCFTKLTSLSRRWSKSKKKVDLSVISLIYDCISSSKYNHQTVQLLLVSDCFSNCLWKLFHEDISMNHVELILLVALHQFNQKLSYIISTIINDDRFGQFILRMLAIVNEIAVSSNFKLGKLILAFFSVLTSRFGQNHQVQKYLFPIFNIHSTGDNGSKTRSISHEDGDNDSNGSNGESGDKSIVFQETTIENNTSPSHEETVDISHLSKQEQANYTLKDNWFANIISHYKKSSFNSDKISKYDAQQFLEQFIRLLIIGVSNDTVRHVFKPWLKKTLFVYYVRIVDASEYVQVSAIQKLNSFLLYCLEFTNSPETSSERFYELQVFLSKNVNTDLALVPSVYNISSSELEDYFRSLLQKELLAIANHLGETQLIEEPVVIIVQVLLLKIFPPRSDIQDTLLLNLTQLTEKELLDDMEGIDTACYQILLHEIPINDGITLGYHDYFNRVLLRLWDLAIEALNRHILQVFSRVLFDANLKMRGKSKYLHKIETITQVAPSTFEIVTTGSINANKMVLLEIVNPNKYAKSLRAREHGINLVRWAKVIPSNGNILTVESNIDDVEELEERFNYFITFPTNPSLERLDNLIKFDMTKMDDLEETDSFLKLHFQVENTTSSKTAKRRKGVTANSMELSEDESRAVASVDLQKCTFVDLDKFSRLELITEEILDKHPNDRTVIITPSTSLVNLFEIESEQRFLRYGIVDEIMGLKKALADAMSDVAKILGKLKIENKTNVNFINYYEDKIKFEWDSYLTKFESNPKELLANYPFSEREFTTFTSIADDFKSILQKVQFIKLLLPIAAKLTETNFENGQLWNYLLNTFNVIISLDDYVNLHNNQNESLRPFKNVVIVNGSFESLPIVLRNNPPSDLNQVVVLGGDIVHCFEHEKVTTISGVRSEFVPELTRLIHPPVLPYNPGFKYDKQIITVEDQLQEAQYCVLLYQYMRLLGYPQGKINVWVHSLRQKALIEEILKESCQQRYSDDSKKSFKYGWPQIIYAHEANHNYDVNDYTITSLYDETNPGTIITDYMGRLGNYYIAQEIPPLHTLPPNYKLQIHSGENYWTKTRTKQIFTIEGTDHMSLYISQMQKTRTGK